MVFSQSLPNPPAYATHQPRLSTIHIYTNNITSIGHSGIIISDVVDHFGTYYLSHDKNKHNKNGMNQIRSISEVSIIKLKNCLDEIDFNEIL